MKIIFLFLFCSCLAANGQRISDENYPIHIGDSLEMIYGSQFLTITDTTLPVVTQDGFASARDVRLVTYFFDSSKQVKKIVYKEGQGGSYYFYFDGTYVRKARVVSRHGYVNLQYYFSNQENELAPHDLDRKEAMYPEAKEWYDVLKIARSFAIKFKALL